MKIKTLIVISIALLFAGNTRVSAQTQKEQRDVSDDPLERLEISASRASNSDPARLLFVVRNKGSKNVKIVRDYLPWNSTSALKLIVVPLASGSIPVTAVMPIEDPRTVTVDVVGGAELRGVLNIEPFFVQWKRLSERESLLVWSLNLYDLNTGRGKRFSGVIEYPVK